MMANQMFGGGFISSRLANRLRQQDGLSYGARSFLTVGSFDENATFGAYAICAPENLDRVEIGQGRAQPCFARWLYTTRVKRCS